MSKPTDPKEMALTFRRAAQIMQARGHGKGLYETKTGQVCAVGALMLAEGKDTQTGPWAGGDLSGTVEFLSSRLWVAISDDDPVERIAEWNDAPERTQAEVVEALVAAARAIEEREAGAVVPVCLRTSDGALWDLSTVPAHGDPRYVLAGCQQAPQGVFAEYGELVDSFGAVPAGGVA